MKKTISITLGKQFFHIEESAFTKLDTYLNAVKNSLDNEGKEEIINDIEDRISELFFERYNENLHTITDEDVDYIISVMGQPEDYALGNETDNTQSQTSQNQTENTFEQIKRKKLYRDGHSRVLGGVCSGMGHYFGIDPVWIRLIVLVSVFFLGLSILVYPLLWLIIPKAVTPSQILEMKGVPVNLDNISEEVKNSMGKYIEIGKEKSSEFLNVLKKIAGVFTVLLSVFYIFGVIAGIFAFLLDYNANNEEFINNEVFSLSPSIAAIIFAITALLPAVWILLLGIKLINGNFRISGKWTLASIILWIGLFIFSALLLKTSIDTYRREYHDVFTKTSKIEQKSFTIDADKEQPLNIQLLDNENDDNYEYNDNVKINFHQTEEAPYVSITENRYDVKALQKKSRNLTKVKVKFALKQTKPYSYDYTENTLKLDKYIAFDFDGYDDDEYPGNVTIDIYINENQQVKLNPYDSDYYTTRLQPHQTDYIMKNGELVTLN